MRTAACASPGRVPGIVYGADKAAQNVEVDHKALLRNLEARGVPRLDTGARRWTARNSRSLLRDYQMHPWKQQVLHVDFQRVDKNRKIHMRVPLHFVNADICPGVKTGGGVVQHTMNEIDIQCLPDDLPAFIEVDLKDMELNETLHVMELAMPKGVEPVLQVEARESVGGVGARAEGDRDRGRSGGAGHRDHRRGSGRRRGGCRGRRGRARRRRRPPARRRSRAEEGAAAEKKEPRPEEVRQRK